MAFAIAGDLCFNPLTDTLKNVKGEEVRLDPPEGDNIRLFNGFTVDDNGYVGSVGRWEKVEVIISPDSQRLQKLELGLLDLEWEKT